jgi:cyclophilin family peptidyl-prolyl cis-trans isomerase
MSKKMMKRIVCNAVATLSAVACLGMATSCETAHPTVEMTITFQDTPYVLEYELYRNIAPSTVKHFLWLANGGYYDGLCVHDYDSSAKRMYTGAYEADANEESGLKYINYKETIAEFEEYENFPVSVWADKEGKEALYTLYGEFGSNGFEVENGTKKQSYGSLTMYYTEKSTAAKVYTPYLGGESDELAARQYKYNSATSQFFISLSTTASSSTNYCTFATLDEDSVEVLESLEEAIAEFITEEYGDDATASDFVHKEKIQINTDDLYEDAELLKDSNAFEVPNAVIEITTVKVKKY